MADNYVLLERIELNASAASVTFNNIPQTGYTDLKLVISARTTYATNGDLGYIYFNGVGTNQTSKRLQGDGFSTSSSSYSTIYFGAAGASDTANTFCNTEIYVPNYTSSNYKSVSIDGVNENNATTAYARMFAGLWSSTAAITSVSLYPNNGFWDTKSTFSLYGVAALGTTPAIAPKADGGNVIATDGTYWYHAFLTNGTFTPQVALNADVLVVAGGGGGGPQVGGGGGAGGVIYFASQSLTATNYSCVIGAGGSGGIIGSSNGTNGGNSTFGALTAGVGGGGGGRYADNNGLNGGSGGGASGGPNFTRVGGTPTQTGTGATAYYGNYGGNNTGPHNVTAAGGGGAGAVGSNATGTNGGAGGAGINTYSSWATATSTGVSGYYAGGGGGAADTNGNGGAGGSGGGGTGGSSVSPGTAPIAGTANTGGGGGGNRDANSTWGTSNGAPGGSGIIIIRYPIAS